MIAPGSSHGTAGAGVSEDLGLGDPGKTPAPGPLRSCEPGVVAYPPGGAFPEKRGSPDMLGSEAGATLPYDRRPRLVSATDAASRTPRQERQLFERSCARESP